MIDEVYLRKAYLVDKKTMSQIAIEKLCCVSTVKKHIDKYGIPTRPRGSFPEDLTGKTFGLLRVIKMYKEKIKYRTYTRCECYCAGCGNTKIVRAEHLRFGNYSSCGCSRGKKKSDNVKWKGCGEISGYMWSLIRITYEKSKKSKKAKDRKFLIELEYIWDLYIKQNRRCAISGLPIIFAKTNRDHSNGKTTASLDRINSDVGYVVGNVQWVHKDVNKLKTDFPQDRLLWLCKTICDYQNEKNSNCP